jgi:hypothetical protein
MGRPPQKRLFVRGAVYPQAIKTAEILGENVKCLIYDPIIFIFDISSYSLYV